MKKKKKEGGGICVRNTKWKIPDQFWLIGRCCSRSSRICGHITISGVCCIGEGKCGLEELGESAVKVEGESRCMNQRRELFNLIDRPGTILEDIHGPGINIV